MNLNRNWFYSHLFKQIRQLSINSQLNQQRTHYDALGIKKDATQTDIKTAYYKLSMVYHPDKNADSLDASQKFRDITEAYKILSNVKTRKLYDRGLLIDNGYQTTTSTTTNDDVVNKFYKSRETRSKPPAPTGRTVIYDFDEWTRTHYGATFSRDLRNRERQRKQEHYRKLVVEDMKSERMIVVIVLLFMFCILVFHGRHDVDKVQIIDDKTTLKKRD